MRGFSLGALASLATSAVVVACATGTDPLGDGLLVGDGTDDSGASSPAPTLPGLPPAGDAGDNPLPDSSTAMDSSTKPPVDSGPKPPVDSGPPPSGGDCVGTNSSQIGGTYDDACDAYYMNTGMSNPCTPGANQCAALNTSMLTFCCYKPTVGSFCYDDYGRPQCLPK